MAIDYVEIRDSTLELIGVIDTAKSIIWHPVFFGVGDFEVYTKVTPESVSILKAGNYVVRPDDIEIGIIESIEVTNDTQDGLMIVAAGRFAKSILDRRVIYRLSGTANKATVLEGNVETNIRKLVSDNAIACAFDSKRNIPQLELGTLYNIPAIIVDENGAATQKQVAPENLLTYTDTMLKEYGLSAIVLLEDERKKLQYTIVRGVDRSVDNTAGNMPIIFSQDFDNLTASVYSFNNSASKNMALIGGEENKDTIRYFTTVVGKETGMQRRELWVNASAIKKTYKDDNDEEHTYTDSQYNAMLKAEGKQGIAENAPVESFTGTIDIVNGNWRYNTDFSLGDIVTVQDNTIGKYANVRITEITEVQDENGYAIEANYQS